MRIIVISTQNRLLSDSIIKYLRERGELMPECVLNHKKKEEPYATCRILKASVLLMEVTPMPPLMLDARLETARMVKEKLPECKIVLLCDETADPETAEGVKEAKKQGEIDYFFFSSLTGEYLASVLDAL